jgi:hypothetical protein
VYSRRRANESSAIGERDRFDRVAVLASNTFVLGSMTCQSPHALISGEDAPIHLLSRPSQRRWSCPSWAGHHRQYIVVSDSDAGRQAAAFPYPCAKLHF